MQPSKGGLRIDVQWKGQQTTDRNDCFLYFFPLGKTLKNIRWDRFPLKPTAEKTHVLKQMEAMFPHLDSHFRGSKRLTPFMSKGK